MEVERSSAIGRREDQMPSRPYELQRLLAAIEDTTHDTRHTTTSVIPHFYS